jgi:protoporphyrin/coproporphyrin ferrochelatase
LPGALVLVNTGTPAAPRRAAVRRFLARFLADPRVVELPRPLWLLLLYGLVLPLRSGRSAHRYRLIWQAEGSPLAVNTARIRAALEQELQGQLALPVLQAFLYSEPQLSRVLEQLREQGVERLLVLPLFPQSSGTTTGAVYDQLGAALAQWRALPELRIIANYGNDAAYIEALANCVRQRRRQRGADAVDHLLISFHGIPQRCEQRGDRYGAQCRQTAERLAAALGLASGEWTLAFQSRFGGARWLLPATDATLRELPRRGVRAVTVICPGFPADCLETLEEIALLGRDTFLRAGGERFDYVPALNADPAHIRALAGLVSRASTDWH